MLIDAIQKLIIGIVIGFSAYVLIRLAAYGIFKSYFQAKEEHHGKKESEKNIGQKNAG